MSGRPIKRTLRDHGVGLSYSWVKKALQTAGLVPQGRKRGPHRRRRERPPCRGCCCTSMPARTAGWPPGQPGRPKI